MPRLPFHIGLSSIAMRGLGRLLLATACAVAGLGCNAILGNSAHELAGPDGSPLDADDPGEASTDSGEASAELDGPSDVFDSPESPDSPVDAGSESGIAFHGEIQITSYVPGAPAEVPLGRPPRAETGDLLLAGLLFGNDAATTSPTVVAPASWETLGDAVIPPDHASLYLFYAMAGPTLSWPAVFKATGTGVAWLVAYGGVDASPSHPPRYVVGPSASNNPSTWPSATLDVTTAGEVLVATFGSYAGGAQSSGPPTWSLPPPWIARSASLADQVRRSGVVGDMRVDQPGSFAVSAQATGGVLPTFVTAGLVALVPR
jgi:hypothetical protein